MSTWILIILCFFVGLPVYVTTITRLSANPKVPRQRVMLVAGLGLVVLILFFAGIGLLVPILRQNNWLTLLQFAVAVSYLWYLWRNWQQRRQAGAILLDLGFPMRVWQVLLAVAFGVVTVVATVSEFVTNVSEDGITLESLGRFAFYITWWGYWLVPVTSRNQICEHGLLMRGSLLRWEKVRGHEWLPERPNTLRLYGAHGSYLSVGGFFGGSELRVPSEHRVRVTELLTQYTSDTASH